MLVMPSLSRRVAVRAGLSVVCFAVVAIALLATRHHAPVALRAHLVAAIDDQGGGEALASDDESRGPSPAFADDPAPDDSHSWTFGSAGNWLDYAQGFGSSRGFGSTTSPGPTPSGAVNDPSPSDHAASGDASWYSTTPYACAHRTIPKGTAVTVTNTRNGKSTTCTVEGWGPEDTSRAIDLSEESFNAIANPDDGVIPVRYTW